MEYSCSRNLLLRGVDLKDGCILQYEGHEITVNINIMMYVIEFFIQVRVKGQLDT